MLALEIRPSYHNGHPDRVLYNQQTINVECDTSEYYFSEGTYWAIRYKNKSLIPITGICNTSNFICNRLLSNSWFIWHAEESGDVPTNGDPPHRQLIRGNVLSYKLDKSMNALLCFAPVWNSTVWVMKTKFLFINGKDYFKNIARIFIIFFTQTQWNLLCYKMTPRNIHGTQMRKIKNLFVRVKEIRNPHLYGCMEIL